MPVLPEINIIIAFAFGLLLLYIIGRVLLMPIRLVFKLIYNGIIGGVVLWLINWVGAYFDFSIAINAATALIVGFLGLPGVILLVVFKFFVA
ncbi:MAG: pro-sigmaK processing inhibitor BofA family protein [Sporomusaceae bacterium]|nr:pro-sigmaK processing inhibitor BofA family protein [Sporomusaceae bacterium]